MPQGAPEECFSLVCDLRSELGDCLKSFEGKIPASPFDHFCVYAASHINRAVDGYILLRKASRIDASKLLIRPAIEAMIRVQAVRINPSLLYRIAFSEFEEDKKWARTVSSGSDGVSKIDAQWQSFKEAYAKRYPDHDVKEQELSLYDAAVAAGLGTYYNSHYRLYCRFTHAAFRATTGTLNAFDPEDDRTIIGCLIVALEVVIASGGSAPNINALRKRVSCLSAEGDA